MKVSWDRLKAGINLRKHGVDFADAAVALEDENALTIEDSDFAERRYKTLALGPDFKVLLIVYALPRPELIRIISARHADPKQTRQYFLRIHHE